MSTKTKGKNLADLISVAQNSEKVIKKDNPSKEENSIEANSINENNTPIHSSEKIIEAIVVNPPAEQTTQPNMPETLQEKSNVGFDENFIKKDYGVGEQVVRIPSSIHFQLKILATCTNTPIGTIISNVLNNFLEANSKEIKKKTKRAV